MTMKCQQPKKSSRNSTKSITKTKRVESLDSLRARIDFIPHETFGQQDDSDEALVERMLASADKPGQGPAELPAHLRRLCEVDLLDHQHEANLFRAMNYLKFRANWLCDQLDPQQATHRELSQIKGLLTKADTIRDHIVKANMRLVMSIVKKFVTPSQSFDDMLSDGIFILMQAVEKFDYSRGFRFSTYAYRSIARHAYRSVTIARRDDARCTNQADESAFEQPGTASSATSDQIWSNLRGIATSMMSHLDRRERFIIRSRYALGSHRKVRTCQFLADKLGISKERVRQLEIRAVSKMREMAAEFDVDELFGAAMA